jgi:hypothetical protein
MTTEERMIKLVADNPNHKELGEKVAIYIRENFLEKIHKEVAKKRNEENGPK